MKYFGTTTMTHFTILAYMSYFFRFRRLNKLQVLAVGTGYFYAFNSINNIMYKLLVDKKIIAETRKFGLEKHAQPNGTQKVRGYNFD